MKALKQTKQKPNKPPKKITVSDLEMFNNAEVKERINPAEPATPDFETGFYTPKSRTGKGRTSLKIKRPIWI